MNVTDDALAPAPGPALAPAPAPAVQEPFPALTPPPPILFPPPPAPAPPPPFVLDNNATDCTFDCGGNTTSVSDQSVIFSCYAGLFLGVVSIVAYSFLWKHVKVYTSRMHLNHVAFKPADVPVRGCFGFQRYWGWLVPVLFTSTEDIFIAAGFDAVVMLKTLEYGVQLFTPMAIVSLAILIPLHVRGDAIDDPGRPAELAFGKLTVANMKNKSDLYWVHFLLAYLFVFYALWLIHRYYQDIMYWTRRYNVEGEDHHVSRLKQHGGALPGEWPTNMLARDSPAHLQHHSVGSVVGGDDAEQDADLDRLTSEHGQSTMLDQWATYQQAAPVLAEGNMSAPLLDGGHAHRQGSHVPASLSGHGSMRAEPAPRPSAPVQATAPPSVPATPSSRGLASSRGQPSFPRRLLGVVGAMGQGLLHSRQSRSQVDASAGLAFSGIINNKGKQGRGRAGGGATPSNQSSEPSRTASLLSHRGDAPHLPPAASVPPGTPPSASFVRIPPRPGVPHDRLTNDSGSSTTARPSPLSQSPKASHRTASLRFTHSGGDAVPTAPLPSNWSRSEEMPSEELAASEASEGRGTPPLPLPPPRGRGHRAAQPSFADMIGSHDFGGMVMSANGDATAASGSQSGAPRGSSPTFVVAGAAPRSTGSLSRPGSSQGLDARSSGGGLLRGAERTSGAAQGPGTPTLAGASVASEAEWTSSGGRPGRVRRAGPAAESGYASVSDYARQLPESPFEGAPPSAAPAAAGTPPMHAMLTAPLPEQMDGRLSQASYASGGSVVVHTEPLTAGASLDRPTKSAQGSRQASWAGSMRAARQRTVSSSQRGGAPFAASEALFQQLLAGGRDGHIGDGHDAQPPAAGAPRPSPLVIDNPADALSTAASSHFHRDAHMAAIPEDGTLLTAIANDRTVIDADQHLADAGRTAAIAGSELSRPVSKRIAADLSSKLPEDLEATAAIDAHEGSKLFKWWVPRTVDKALSPADVIRAPERPRHDSMWYDPGAIMSRKPSIRFRRTIDVQLPFFNEQGVYEGQKVKRALEVQKYCVLVTDVPVLDTQQELAEEAAYGSPAHSSPLSPNESRHLNPALLSMRQRGAEPSPTGRMMQWVNETAHRAVTLLRGAPTAPHQPPEWDALPRQPTPPPAYVQNNGTVQRLHSYNNAHYVPISDPEARQPLGVQLAETRRIGQAVGEAACAGVFDDGGIALSEAGGESALDVPVLGCFRSEGATDLRTAPARAQLAAHLKRSLHASAPVVEGAAAARIWRRIMGKASVPPSLEAQLCEWHDREVAERAESAAEPEHEQGADGSGGRRPRRGGPVAEGFHRANMSVDRWPANNSVGLDQGTPAHRRGGAGPYGSLAGMGSLPAPIGSAHLAQLPSGGFEDNITTPVGVLTWQEDEAAGPGHARKPTLAMDAATLTRDASNKARPAQQGDTASESKSAAPHILGNRLREEVSRKVAAAFDMIFHDSKPRLVPVLDHKKVEQELIKWDQYHQRLELIEAKEEVRRRAAAKNGKPFVPLKHRTGWKGVFGPLVESRAFFVDRIIESEKEIDTQRELALHDGMAISYFVIFETQMAATVAAQCVLHSGDTRLFKTKQAPGPDNVNWGALWRNGREWHWRRPVAIVLYTLLLSVPLGVFAGALTQLQGVLCDVVGDPESNGFANFCSQGGFFGRVVTQVLPAVLVIVWQNAVMPVTLYSITLFEGTRTSLASLDRRILILFFYWDLFNIFFGGMLAGSIVRQIRRLVTTPGDIQDILGESLPASSNFFINYLALRAFGLVPFRLILPHGGIWRWLFKCGGKCGCVLTARDAAAFVASASIRYGRELGVMMLVFIIGWAYATVSPLVLVVAAIYFMSSWVVWRWQIIYVYVRCYEGGGSLWRSIVMCLISCLFVFVFFTSCVFVAKEAFYQAAILFVTLPFVIAVFWRHCRERYDPALKYMPLEVAANAPRVKVNEMSYIAAPLRPGCSGWHPEWGKAWESWGAPSGS